MTEPRPVALWMLWLVNAGYTVTASREGHQHWVVLTHPERTRRNFIGDTLAGAVHAACVDARGVDA